MTLADRIVVMRRGPHRAGRHAGGCLRPPATTFVAGFIGAPPMNLVPGRIVRAHDGPARELPAGVVLPLGADPCGGRPATERRSASGPSISRWAPRRPGGRDRGRRPTIVEPLGSDTLVGISLGEHNLQVRLPPRQVRRAGELVRLNVAPEHVHLFDRDGRRIAG